MKLSDKYDSAAFNQEWNALRKIFKPLTESSHYVGDVPLEWCEFSSLPMKLLRAATAVESGTHSEQLRTKRELRKAFAATERGYISEDSTFYEYSNLRHMWASAKEFADKWLSEEARKA